MNLLKHPIRLSIRLSWLAAELIFAACKFLPVVMLQSADVRIHARARWLQQSCRRVLRVLRVIIEAHGPVPSAGLLVSNHLSYLDVLVLGALTPAVFVSKSEVRCWPVFGWFASKAGTIFVDRRRRMQTVSISRQMELTLGSGVALILFPEGSSSDGKTVLPFKSSLLEPARKTKCPLSAGALRYELEDGDVGEEVCYWKDMTFFPHLLNILTKSRIVARLNFLCAERTHTSRKEMAEYMHSIVVGLNTRKRISIAQPAF